MMCLNRIRLECVVQFNAPSVIGVFGAAGSFSSEVVVSVQFNALLESYACASNPEVNIRLVIPTVVELVGEVQGRVAEEVRAEVSLYIVNTQLPAANFVCVYSAIGEACSPECRVADFNAIIVTFSLGLNVVTIEGEVAVAKAYCSTYAPNIGMFISAQNINIVEFLRCAEVEGRNISTVSYMAGQFCEPGFGAVLCSVSIACMVFISRFQVAVASVNANLAIVPASGDAIVFTIFIPECTSLVKSYALTANAYIGLVGWCPFGVNTIHCGVSIIIVSILEVHVGDETAIYSYLVIDVSLYVDTHTAYPGIIMVFSKGFIIVVFGQIMLVLHTSIAGPVEVADFLFQIAYANAQVSQFVCVFASQFVEGCTLFSVQLVFFSHEAGDDLSQFVTGHVTFTFEGAVRIAFYDALVGEVGYCLVSPVIRCNIRERICSVCGYASGECCYCSDCENLFHVLRSF